MNIPQYKTKIASRYMPVDPEQIGLKIIEAEYYYTSVKHDGYFAALEIKNGIATLFDRNGNPLEIKAITNAAKDIKEDVVFAGEICLFKEGKSTNNREVKAALDEPDKFDLRFGVFDVIAHKGEEASIGLKEKTELMKSLAVSKEVFAIEQTFMESRKDIIAFYKAIAGKEEGAVVRSSDGIIYKIKAVITLDMLVLGYALSASEENTLRELLLGIAKEDGSYQIVGKCGTGFTDKERLEIATQFKEVASNYTEVSGAKTAFIMVEPKVVVEISCLDVISENTKGNIKKASLTFDAQNGYNIKEQSITVSCISPVFLRFRTDKKANSLDAGEHQFIHLIDKASAEETSELKASTINKREVYTKSGKGGTAVRKFIGLKTNKETSGQYAPFMLVYSDFSAGRKTPLEQEVFLCASAEEMEKKMSELIEENIKKGWEKV
jgi:ATP-dependent DNA ligase